MGSLLTILLLIILFAGMAMLYTDGMWNNALRLVNTVTAALLAMNFFEPLANALEGWQPAYTYVWDFLSLWIVFAVSFSIMRALTDQVSKVQVRFLKLADQIGGAFFSLWVGWIMVCFTLTTLHAAPLAREFLYGGFHAETPMFMGLAPDRQWLGFTQKESRGAFSRMSAPADGEKYVFDPKAEFMPKYATRRANVQVSVATKDTICVGP